jgi:hypothetical protein
MPTPSLLETKWQIARRWAAEARQQQASHVRQARLALGFAVAAAVSGAIATAIGVGEKEGSSFSLSGLFALMAGTTAAISTFFGRHILNEQSQAKWIVARATAENLQSECYRFAARIGAYTGSKSEAAKSFDARTNELVAAARDKGIEPPVKAAPSSSRLTPAEDMSAEWYVQNRLTQQKDWYFSRSEEHRNKARLAQRLGLMFGILAALLGFLGSITQGWLSITPFIGAMTTIATAVALFASVDRHVFLASSYGGYAEAIASLLARFGEGLVREDDLVLEGETLLASEYAAWTARTTMAPQLPD